MGKIRSVVSALLILLSFSCWANMLQEKKTSFENLCELSVVDPHVLLSKADTLDVHSALPFYQIEMLRACAYRSLSMRSLVFYHAHHALEAVGIDKDPDTKAYVYMLLVESAVLLNHLDIGTKYIAEGVSYARMSKNILLEANMIQMESTILRKLGQTVKSYTRMQDAIRMLAKSNQPEALLLMSHIYGYLMSFYIEDLRYNDAWQLGKKRSVFIDKMEKEKQKINVSWIDNQKGYLYSKMALLSEIRKESKLAEEYCKMFYRTNFSKSNMGVFEINNYLLLRGDFRQVLQNNDIRFQLNNTDTLGTDYLNALYQNSKAYKGLGDYEKAYYLLEKINNVRKTLRIGEYKQKVQQMRESNQKMENEMLAHEISFKIKLRNYFIVGLLVLLIVGGAFVYYILRKKKTISFQKRQIVSLVTELTNLKEEEEEIHRTEFGKDPNGVPSATQVKLPAEEAPITSDHILPDEEIPYENLRDKILFDDFDRKVRVEKIYLQYQFDHDDYALLMGVNHNRFARIMKNYGGGNLTHYLNDLRLEYSVFLLREHPELSNMEVAKKCALPKLSIFCRLFKERFGVNPTVFRQEALSKK